MRCGGGGRSGRRPRAQGAAPPWAFATVRQRPAALFDALAARALDPAGRPHPGAARFFFLRGWGADVQALATRIRHKGRGHRLPSQRTGVVVPPLPWDDAAAVLYAFTPQVQGAVPGAAG